MENKSTGKTIAIVILSIFLVMFMGATCFFAYEYFSKDEESKCVLDEKIKTIKIPYAKQGINGTEEITKDNIGYLEVPEALVDSLDIIININELIGKYVDTGTSIPEGGLFYKKQVVEKADLANKVFDDLEDGHTAFALKVDNHTTYGNSIYSGDKIDIYVKLTDNGKISYGKFISDVAVVAVRDSSGRNVFDTNPPLTPAELILSIDSVNYELLMKASYLSEISIIPVPKNKNIAGTSDDPISYEYIKDYINSKVNIDD